jgi:hypothetical protein
MKVYAAIRNVASQMAKDGIGKTRENKEQRFKFRGIDETLNALAPVLAANGLVVLPRMLSRQITERQTKSGNPLFSVVVDAEFDFVATEDGSKHTVKTFGEAMDTGDKATNKAMSIAYKYAAFLAFCIPVEGMGEDADTTTHDVAPIAGPAGYDDWFLNLRAVADEGTDALKATWLSSKPTYRTHLATTNNAAWEALKAKAAQVKA